MIRAPSRLHARAALVASFIAMVACGSDPPVAGPRIHTCTEIGCVSDATVRYVSSIDGAYTLQLTVEGYNGATECPTPSGVMAATSVEGVYVSCDNTHFDLYWASPSGPGARDGGPLALTVTATVGDLGAAIPTGTVSLLHTGRSQPNGPDCDPVCDQFSGTRGSASE
jgi:hypothetical protein